MTQQPQYSYTPVTPQNSTLAIVSLVLGILSWLILPFLGSIGAVITGHLAKTEIRESAGQLTGNGLATAGLVLGYIQLAIVVCMTCVIVPLILLGPGIESVFSSITESLY